MKNRLIVLALMVALGVAGLGLYLRIPAVIAPVFIALALFCGVTGVQMIVTRRAEIPTSESTDSSREYHTGISAQLWGVLFLFFSVPLALLGVGYWRYRDHPPADILEGVVRSPIGSGLVLIAAGAAIGLYGLTRLIPGREAFRETERRPFARVVTGLYVCSVATLLVGAGVVRALSPGTLTRIRDATYATVLDLLR